MYNPLSEVKSKVLNVKMIFYSPANKAYFLKRGFALNLTHFESGGLKMTGVFFHVFILLPYFTARIGIFCFLKACVAVVSVFLKLSMGENE